MHDAPLHGPGELGRSRRCFKETEADCGFRDILDRPFGRSRRCFKETEAACRCGTSAPQAEPQSPLFQGD